MNTSELLCHSLTTIAPTTESVLAEVNIFHLINETFSTHQQYGTYIKDFRPFKEENATAKSPSEGGRENLGNLQNQA